jgi:curved DNA-binding protein CbpA
VNDAYYTLSDPKRRKEYDAARNFHGMYSGPEAGGAGGESSSTGGKTGGFGFGFPWGSAQSEEQEQERADHQFSSVFEEMLHDEAMNDTPAGASRPVGRFWSLVGGLSGGALGFILANVPGALAGAVAGNRLGAVRDARGKSVYEVFQTLPAGDRAKLLSELAAKVFAQAVSS